jgi:hypothetical protein
MSFWNEEERTRLDKMQSEFLAWKKESSKQMEEMRKKIESFFPPRTSPVSQAPPIQPTPPAEFPIKFAVVGDLGQIGWTNSTLQHTAKSIFSAKDYNDYMALGRAYEGWKDVEREGSAYEYCWRNNRLSHSQSLVRAIICSGLFLGIASVVHRETSMSFKMMDDSQVLLYENSVNACYQKISNPWLVFGEKVKVNTVFICDSTGVSDSMLIIFGGALGHGVQAGHLKGLEGQGLFFAKPEFFLGDKEDVRGEG